jgi:methyl-accepting chemotaxis protein
MLQRVLAEAGRLPGVTTAVAVATGVAAIPGRADRVLRGIESLQRLAELDESLRMLSTFEESLARLADLGASVNRLATAVEVLPGLADSAAALPELTRHAEALARLSDSAAALPELARHAAALTELTEHAASLTELTAHAASLTELTQHAAALPELVPRVQSVELMVESIIGYLGTLQPTVDELTLAASDLQRAVGPIGRIAGRIPGSRAREAVEEGLRAKT